MIKILNLYAGLGGNRKLWSGDIEVTAVEQNKEVAAVYQKYFRNDKVVIADAHQYLLENFQDYDIIWSSPPCQSHSKLNYTSNVVTYPDMKLYSEIILLERNFKGKYIVENVVPYYKSLRQSQRIDRHLFWTNFKIGNYSLAQTRKPLSKCTVPYLSKILGFDTIPFKIKDKRQALRNCVLPEIGKFVMDRALGIQIANNAKQETLLFADKNTDSHANLVSIGKNFKSYKPLFVSIKGTDTVIKTIDMKYEEYETLIDTLVEFLSNALTFQSSRLPALKKQLYELFWKVDNKNSNYWGKYHFDKFKVKNKEFASWFLGLDQRFFTLLFQYFDIKLTFPKIKLSQKTKESFINHPAANDEAFMLKSQNIDTFLKQKSHWGLLPDEYLIVKQFCIYSLNNSSLFDFEGEDFPVPTSELIDFKGWANYFLFQLNRKQRVVFIKLLFKNSNYLIY